MLLRTIELHKDRQLTFYGASFLALADHLGVPLVTADAVLCRKSRGRALLLKSLGKLPQGKPGA